LRGGQFGRDDGQASRPCRLVEWYGDEGRHDDDGAKLDGDIDRSMRQWVICTRRTEPSNPAFQRDST
jgi:hypothetical protein